ncbi:MAG: RNA polymerase sigma factor RpoD/SigA [Deltaproteobacteria bacterium]|nr:RNA polymerase sigma factor RpoD/SigA [Deltaproteobacteria bacterium]
MITTRHRNTKGCLATKEIEARSLSLVKMSRQNQSISSKALIGKGESLPRWPFPYIKEVGRDDTPFKSPAKESGITLAKILDKDLNRQLETNTKEGDERDEMRDTGSDSIRIYFKSIRKFLRISHEEEKYLAERIEKGDEKARQRMIEANLRLVISIAKRHIHRGLPLHDLIEEGNIGLIKAVERFKASKGCKFSTYATFWIKQAVERAIINQADVVRIPIHVTADVSKIMRATRELIATLNRKPDIREISEKTGLSGRYIKKLNNIIRKSYSLEAALYDDPDQSLLDHIEDETAAQPVDLINRSMRMDKINDWLKMLDIKESAIIRRRFGLDEKEPQTLELIGKAMGVSRERIRQLENRALSKLRKIAGAHDIYSLEAI